jgi:multiple sugar transport system substrate-binding protein
MNSLLGRWWFWALALLAAGGAGLAIGWVTNGESSEVAATADAAASAEGAVTSAAVDAAGTELEANEPIGPCDGKVDQPVELTLTTHSSSDAYLAAVDGFNDGPGRELGITVELLNLGDRAYEARLRAAEATADFPDIVEVDGPFIHDFAWNNYVQPLGNCVDSAALDDFLPSILAQGSYQGQLYSLSSYESGLGLWAKRSALTAVEARIPASADDAWTAEEFEQILRDLAEQGDAAPLDISWWYQAREWRTYAFAPVVQSAGGDLIDRADLLSADGTLNGPEAVGALTTFQRWVEDGLIDPDGTDESGFIDGDVAISWAGHWAYNSYSNTLGDDLVLLPLPDFGTGSASGMGSWQWAMSSTTSDPDAVWAFIDYVTSSDQVALLAGAEGAVPSRRSVLEADPSFAPGGDRYLYRTNLEGAPDVARPRPGTPAYGTTRDAFSSAFVSIVRGVDVQAALDDAVAKIDGDITINDGYRQPNTQQAGDGE